jgi:predicted PurR-regulated permease PerM
VFLAMIRHFLVTLFLAAILSGLTFPIYRTLKGWMRGRRTPASLGTLLLLFLVVVIPLLGFLAVVAQEAFAISKAVRPWIENWIREPRLLSETLSRLPGYEHLAPYRDEIVTKLGQIVEGLGSFVFQSLSNMTRGSLNFFFQLFLMVYAMYFFLIDEGALLRRILFYIPLTHEDESRLVQRFVSVTRATLKGTLVIGALQGLLGGIALAVAGVGGAVFWGTVMMVLSIIPGVGTALVWVPAAVVLLAGGHLVAGIFLILFCSVVVGSVDNLVRPRLVGRDTEMHDLLILFGTLGGLILFGLVGFIIGPIIAALFVTAWDIYGTTFRADLPPSPGVEDPSAGE